LLAVLALAIFTLSSPISEALAQQTLSADLREIVGRLSDAGGDATKLSGRDRALLFKNNDAVNAARLNGEIPDHLYQGAQNDFASFNRQFAADSAAEAGAEFTVQQRTTDTFSPGTDSDYITVVQDKKQITKMQNGYNERVNNFLSENGVLDQPSNTWHNKLDTDFMADPRYVTEAEFREVAKLNNDAYKRRHAAEFEKIKRAGGGKIGPQHVTATAEEMSDFATKKGHKIHEMFENPSQFNDPVKRAEAIRLMAQEQKYITRIEDLEDFLRAQEGLPARPRGTSLAAAGSKRSPHNVGTIREAHALAEQTRSKALQDLIETMGEVAHKNPQFTASATDDIVKILAKLPPGERATAMGILKTRNAGLARQVDAALDGLPRASGASALDDVARAGKMRRGLQAAADAMDALGKVAAAADVIAAAAQLKEYFDAIRMAMDPATSAEEAQTLFEKAQEIAIELSKSSALIAIMERHPAVAIAYGAWSVLCLGGEWVSSNRYDEEFATRPAASGGCLDRQLSAWDRFKDWWSGKEALDELHKREICEKFKGALADGRLKLRQSWMDDFLSREEAVKHACWRLASGESLSDMLDAARVAAVPTSPPPQPGPGPTPEKKTSAADCDPAQVAKAKPNLDQGFVATEYKGATAWTGGGLNPDCPAFGPAAKSVDDGIGGEAKRKADPQKHKADATKEAADKAKQKADAAKKADEAKRAAARVAEACRRAKEILDRGNEHYQSGRVSEFRVALVNAERELDPLKDHGACPEERRKIAKGAGQADLLENVIKAADQALASCEEGRLRKLSGLLAKTNHPFVSQLRSRVDRMTDVASKVGKADAARANGRPADASLLYRQSAAGLNADAGACPNLAQQVRDGQEAIRTASLAPKASSSALAETNACKARLGRLGAAVPDSNSLSGYRCDCEQPYQLDGSACVAPKSPSDLARERDSRCPVGHRAGPVDRNGDFKCLATKETADTRCREHNRPGYFAGPIKDDGTYSCIPTKETADAWCRENGGPGAIAGRINADGSHNCALTQEAANARCQAANPGMQGVYAGAIRADGSYNCLQRPQVARRPSQAEGDLACQRANNNQNARASQYLGNGNWNCTIVGPQHDARSSAAAAAVAGAVIQGVIGAIGNQRSGGSGQSVGGCQPGAVGGIFRDCHGRLNTGGGSGLRHDSRTSISGH
jgi:hypothetical protein